MMDKKRQKCSPHERIQCQWQISLLLHPLLVDGPVLLPVDDEGGEVGGYEGVDSCRGPAEETVGGGERAGQGAEQHPGLVESQQPHLTQPAPLGHLQGQPDHQLHQHVQPNVHPVGVDGLVGEKPPDLLPLDRVVDEVGTPGGGLGEARPVDTPVHQFADVNIVPDVEPNLRIQIVRLSYLTSLVLETCLDDGENGYEDRRWVAAVSWFEHHNL